MMPRPPALETAAARRPPDTLAIPARTIGCLMPRRDVSGVVIGPGAVMLAMSVLCLYVYDVLSQVDVVCGDTSL